MSVHKHSGIIVGKRNSQSHVCFIHVICSLLWTGYQYGRIPWNDADVTCVVDNRGVAKFCLNELCSKVCVLWCSCTVKLPAT